MFLLFSLISFAFANNALVNEFMDQFHARVETRDLPNHRFHFENDRNPITGDITCGSNQVFEYHQSLWKKFSDGQKNVMKTTPCFETKCDDPTIRDATKVVYKKLNVVFTVWNDQMTPAELTHAIKEYEAKMKKIGIIIHVLETNFVTDLTYGQCLSSYDGTMDWYFDLMKLKKKHARFVGDALNIFVGCQTKGMQGTLLGIATFPWDPTALTASGGLWMNAVAMDPDDVTLMHESGHCLGLWHTFHGVDEVEHCEANANACGLQCCERPHTRNNSTSGPSNTVGDLCSDTAAAPRSWHCADPKGDACDGVSWTKFGPVDYHNIMGYAMLNPITNKPEKCQTGFSEQQKRRVHCYLDDKLVRWTQ